jgi:tetratricopeptide (TPR) repeat protein
MCADKTVSTLVADLAAEIKERGRRSAAELPPLLERAEQLADDDTQELLTRALAHRAAANALQLLTRFDDALKHYDEATRMLETLDAPLELGRTLHAKVAFLSYLGRFDELFECALRARELFEASGQHQLAARLDSNLAYAYFRLDRHVEALNCSERALAVLEHTNDREGILAATINSAVTLSSMHRFDRAEACFERALQLATDLNIPAWIRLSRYNLAYLRYLGGEPGEALRELAQLRDEYSAVGEERQLCVCWLDEAEILMEIGDLEESIQASRKALALANRIGLNYETGKAYLYEAAARMRLGDEGDPAELLGKALDLFQACGNSVQSAVSTLQAAMFCAEGTENFAVENAKRARSILEHCGLPHRLALADIIIGRLQRSLGDLPAASASFESAMNTAASSQSKWMQFHACYEFGVTLQERGNPEGVESLRQAEAMLDALWNRLGSDDLKMAFLGDRENVYTHLVRSVVSESPARAFELSEKARSRVLRERLTADSAPDSSSDIRTCVSEDETLVEYFLSGEDVFIFTVDRDELFCTKISGAVSRLRERCAHLDRHLSSCSVKWERLESASHHLEATAVAHLQSLYSDLIAPVRARLRRSVIFVPHGFLHGVPMQALHDGTRYLAECHQITYSPSASLYCAPPPEQEYDGALFVAFSGEGRASSVQEIEQCAAAMPQSSVLINPNMHQLHSALQRPRTLVHIAGHAQIDLAGGKVAWIETPAGRLTSSNLMDMRIRARTVVITGCQTARRLIQPGDEWLGLMRAFYLAGASTIVSALWDIRGESACRFSSEFYKHFDGYNGGAAAHAAVNALRSWQAHPYFWSGFGVFGRKDGQRL